MKPKKESELFFSSLLNTVVTFFFFFVFLKLRLEKPCIL